MQITIHTPTGKEVIITLSHHHSGIALDCEMPALNLKVRAFAVHPLKAPKQGATHYLDAYQHSIGLDDANAQLVREAITAFQATYQHSPEGQRAALRKERRDLQDEIAGMWDAWEAAREKAFAQDTGAGWDKVREYEAKAEAAKAVLAAFDAAHPDIIAEITKEKDAATERFLKND